MSKSPIVAPSTLDALLALGSISASAKLMCIILVRRSVTSPLRAEQRYDVDEVSLACGLAVDDGRHAARELHRADLCDVGGNSVRLIGGSDVCNILNGTGLERAAEDVVVEKGRAFTLPPLAEAEGGEEGDPLEETRTVDPVVEEPPDPLAGVGPDSTKAEIASALEAFGVRIQPGTTKADLVIMLATARGEKSA